MDTNTTRVEAFYQLGRFLSQFSREGITQKEEIQFNDLFFDGFKHQLKVAAERNTWFTQENLLFATENWSKALSKEALETWTAPFENGIDTPKNIAVIMAGNIPMVGFHDFLSVLISGHTITVKQSSNDKHLLPFLAKYLEYVCPELKGKIQFTEEKLPEFDAVIATGSNNTARYFEHYFKDKPSIIRKNRNSVAVLSGTESSDDLEQLSEDVFRYFGLGCRSVSKLFVPKGYDFDAFFRGMYNRHEIINNAKYANNYDYNKAVYLMSEFDILENGFLMIKEDASYASPIASVFYEYYDTKDSLLQKLADDAEQIQCVVSSDTAAGHIPFGKTQFPELWDYADGVNTLEFLHKL